MNFAIIGSMGRMGQAIAKLSVLSKEMKLVAAIEYEQHPSMGLHYGNLLGVSNINCVLSKIDILDSIKNLDGIIDFSSPESSVYAVNVARNFKIPIVIGTTGFTDEQLQKISVASSIIPILQSTNMSVGVNLLFHLTHKCSEILSKYNFDPEISEIHHKLKKDSPSGTAKTLSEMILKGYGWSQENIVYGREGLIGERPQKQLGVHAVRGGDVVGEHTVSFFGNGEKIELYHQATSRDTFAAGAIEALLFLKEKSPKMYNMGDVLGFKK